MSQPWMKFYPTDWRGDQGLRAVSLAARGLWIECLMIMHEANPYGHLVLGGQPVSVDVLSRMVGASPSDVEQLLAELAMAGVYSRTGRGIIYSRRMTKDKQKANKCRKAAKTRWSQATDDKEENRRPNGSTNGSGIALYNQKPDTRSQSTLDLLNENSGNNNPENGYALEVGCIRLTWRDLDRWIHAFSHVSVESELIAAEPWLRKQANWFQAAAGLLAKKERAAVIAFERARSPPSNRRREKDPLGNWVEVGADD